MDPKNTPPTPPVDPAKENEALKKRVAELEASQTVASKDEAVIRTKMTAGLTREQAVASIKNQRAFDAKKKDLAKK